LIEQYFLAQRSDEPGIAVSVTRGAEVIARRFAGLASLPHRVPIGPETRFHIVSASKTFLAAATIILASRGALRLDEDVRAHVPELPSQYCGARTVTIRHLLSMTSGLRDVLEIERLRGVWHPSPSRRRDLLDLAFRQTAASAPAGTQYMYANVNFVLLEEIIARASGMSLDAFLQAEICGPLGLFATAARPHEGVVLPDLAEPYALDADGAWSRATDLLGIAGDTLTSSLDDLTRWLLALRAGRVNGIEVTAVMAERARLADGRPVHYGLGLAVRRYRGLTVLCHTGTQPGYKAHLAFVPERDVGLVVLSNRDDTRPTALAAAIMEETIGDDFPARHPGAEARARWTMAGVAPEEVARIAGSYVDRGTGEWVTLAIEDGALRGETLGDPFVLYRGSDGVFRDGEDYQATVPVELGVDLEPGRDDVTCRLDIGGQAVELVKCRAPAYTPAALVDFAGVYESEEITSRHCVRVDGARLIVEYGLGLDGGLAFPMEPIAPDLFLVRPTAPGLAYRHVFRFNRDPAGAVQSAVVTMERLKGVMLRRARAPAETARS
jgi:CubicO group peptidase (beta-lactamase class C family)